MRAGRFCRLLLSSGLNSFNNDFINRAKVALLDFFLNQPFRFWFDFDGHRRHLQPF